MSTPALLLGTIISLFIGSVFHIWRGGKAGRLLLYLILSIIGFWIGHFSADFLKLNFDKLGQLHLVFGIISSVAFLFLGHWLSLIDRGEPSNR